MIEIVNRQRRHPIDVEQWQSFTEKAIRATGRKGAVATVAFVSDRAMRRLNQVFRGRPGSTDVLSFPVRPEEFEEDAETNLGDVVISVERAAAQCARHGLDLDREIAQLILHGILHLCGYDHETDTGEMNMLELRLRRRLGID